MPESKLTLSPQEQIIYNKFATKREKNVKLKELANAKWNGNMPEALKKAMTLGKTWETFNRIWQDPIRGHICTINKKIWPDEIIIRTDVGKYMLTKRNSLKFDEWIVRSLRNTSSLGRTDKLLQSIESTGLPMKNGEKLEDKKQDSHLACRALQNLSSWARKILKSKKKNKISKR